MNREYSLVRQCDNFTNTKHVIPTSLKCFQQLPIAVKRIKHLPSSPSPCLPAFILVLCHFLPCLLPCTCLFPAARGILHAPPSLFRPWCPYTPPPLNNQPLLLSRLQGDHTFQDVSVFYLSSQDTPDSFTA